MTEFLAMGGHGAYVWSAYGISALALALIGGLPLVALKRTMRRLQEEWLEPPSTDTVEGQ